MKKRHALGLLFTVAILFFGCQKEYFTETGMAQDHFFLKSGNQHMPITVSGNVDSKKFLVLIHGGPGGNGLDYQDKYAQDLAEKEMAVVYWDQRFAGNTQGNGGSSDINEFRSDIKKLLILLKAKYGADKNFYLCGHSWGGFLSPYFLADADNQNMVKGWIQIGGAHNYHLNDSLTREMLIFYGNLELAAGRNTADWTEIVDWCKQNGFEGRENAGKLNGFAHRAESLIPQVTQLESSDSKTSHSPAMFSHWANGLASNIRQIDLPAYTNRNSDQLHKIKIPTLLLWGKYDFVCPSALAQDIETHSGSADINKIIYANSGHSPMVNEPQKFWADLIAWVKIH